MHVQSCDRNQARFRTTQLIQTKGSSDPDAGWVFIGCADGGPGLNSARNWEERTGYIESIEGNSSLQEPACSTRWRCCDTGRTLRALRLWSMIEIDGLIRIAVQNGNEPHWKIIRCLAGYLSFCIEQQWWGISASRLSVLTIFRFYFIFLCG